MKKNIFFWLLVFASCRHTDNPDAEKGRSSWVDVKNWNLERLEMDSMSINGKIPLKTTKAKLFQFLGKPDTIVAIYPKFSHLDRHTNGYQMVYFKDLRYSMFDESIQLSSINFEGSNIKIFHPRITLSQNTDIEELQTIFPESGRLIRGFGNTFTGFMQLQTTKARGVPTFWVLVFKHTKLIRMDYVEAFP